MINNKKMMAGNMLKNGDKKNDKDNKKSVIFNVLSIIVVIIMLNGIVHLCTEMKYAFDDYRPKKTTMTMFYNDEDFVNIANYYLNYNISLDDKELKEFANMGKYYTEAMIYKGYKVSGDKEGMEKQLKKMNEAYKNFGSLSKGKEKIDKQLGID